MSNSLGVMDCTVGLVYSVFYLPDKPVKLREKILEENVIYRSIVKWHFRLVHYTYCLLKEICGADGKFNPVNNHTVFKLLHKSLQARPKGQGLKLVGFAHWM